MCGYTKAQLWRESGARVRLVQSRAAVGVNRRVSFVVFFYNLDLGVSRPCVTLDSGPRRVERSFSLQLEIFLLLCSGSSIVLSLCAPHALLLLHTDTVNR